MPKQNNNNKITQNNYSVFDLSSWRTSRIQCFYTSVFCEYWPKSRVTNRQEFVVITLFARRPEVKKMGLKTLKLMLMFNGSPADVSADHIYAFFVSGLFLCHKTDPSVVEERLKWRIKGLKTHRTVRVGRQLRFRACFVSSSFSWKWTVENYDMLLWRGDINRQGRVISADTPPAHATPGTQQRDVEASLTWKISSYWHLAVRLGIATVFSFIKPNPQGTSDFRRNVVTYFIKHKLTIILALNNNNKKNK